MTGWTLTDKFFSHTTITSQVAETNFGIFNETRIKAMAACRSSTTVQLVFSYCMRPNIAGSRRQQQQQRGRNMQSTMATPTTSAVSDCRAAYAAVADQCEVYVVTSREGFAFTAARKPPYPLLRELRPHGDSTLMQVVQFAGQIIRLSVCSSSQAYTSILLDAIFYYLYPLCASPCPLSVF